MITIGEVEKAIHRAGLSAVGISKPALERKYLARYRIWIDQNYNAGMSWTTREPELRANILNRFPWVKSVVVVLDNYFKEIRLGANPMFASYARGEDYHRVVTEKLLKTLTELKAIDNTTTGKIFVDSGAIMEKAFAEQAGLGWIGKNGLLIGENIGSFCFIGVLLLNKQLPAARRVPGECGKCEICIEKCPTGAIISPGLIDARKCISYLTVEKRGRFSKDEKKLLNNWLFGCDICQECCPYNQRWAKETEEVRYSSAQQRYDCSLQKWDSIDKNDFMMMFRDTPVLRLKFSRFRRNIEALGKNNKIGHKYE